jgi:predicted O-methyltransferase YrrM
MNTIDLAASHYWKDPTFGPDWFLWDQRLPSLCTYPELEAILECVRRPFPTGNCIEIGTAWGGATLAIALANRERRSGERVITCDPYPDENWNTVQRALGALSMARLEPDVIYICGSSMDLAAILPLHSARLVLVDGSHENEWVRRDLEVCTHLVRPGGLILLHDHLDGAPVQVETDKFLKSRPSWPKGSRSVGSLFIIDVPSPGS